MDLWNGPLERFLAGARSGSIASEMAGRFVSAHKTLPSVAELHSWQNSLAALGDALDAVAGPDVGVRIGGRDGERGLRTGVAGGAGAAAEGSGPSIGVATEYHLPLTGMRIDAMLFGRDREGRDGSLVLELKQWSDVSLQDEFALNVTMNQVEYPHPSKKARDYANWLRDYHSEYASGSVSAASASFCHNLGPKRGSALRDARFELLLESSPLFLAGEEDALASHVRERVGSGAGTDVMARVIGGNFRPGPGVVARLEEVLRRDREWNLLDEQRVAHQAVLAAVRRAQARRLPSAFLVRGGPGTGKTVIAVQLLADALRLGWSAAHSTGGKAFTTALRSKFRGAGDLFLWNLNLRGAATQALDLLLVDEAHRIRETSDTRFTRTAERGRKAQVDELLDAAKVTVFFLDEHQFVRPDEVGRTALIEEAARRRNLPLTTYDLAAQFRCGGCEEYLAWIDALLGYRPGPGPDFRREYALRLLDSPAQLDDFMRSAAQDGVRARIVAGFCWEWSNPNADGTLVQDVQVGSWSRPWNRKRDEKKHYTPLTDPYTKWADTDEGLDQVGCIYSAQGFEFERVGVIWGPDLVWRSDRWVARPELSMDRPIRGSKAAAQTLLRNAYRVLLTRGSRETAVLCLDAETRAKLAADLPRGAAPRATG